MSELTNIGLAAAGGAPSGEAATEQAALPYAQPETPAPVQLPDAPAPRSWIARVMLDAVGRTAARLGLGWIVIVAFCAAFAPLLASSFPLLIKMDGKVSSPLLQN